MCCGDKSVLKLVGEENRIIAFVGMNVIIFAPDLDTEAKH